MRLTFFGRLRDAVGQGALDRDIPDHVGDSDALRAWIGTDYPELLDGKVRLALDDVMTTGPAPIDGIAEAAFLPPVSGG
ncbi:MAG: MoaD/ThiS family protein [Sphingomicrobium sp.]